MIYLQNSQGDYVIVAKKYIFILKRCLYSEFLKNQNVLQINAIPSFYFSRDLKF